VSCGSTAPQLQLNDHDTGDVRLVTRLLSLKAQDPEAYDFMMWWMRVVTGDVKLTGSERQEFVTRSRAIAGEHPNLARLATLMAKAVAEVAEN